MKKAILFAANGLKNHVQKEISVRTGLLLTKPLLISISPSQRCNLKCLMCRCWQEQKDYISSDDIIGFLGDVKGWLGNQFFVQLSGGEPLIYRGIFDVIKFCAENEITCKVSTNGYNLTPRMCDKVIEAGLRYLSVSIDSHVPEVHDRFRGRKGTFKRAIAGLKYLRSKSKITLGISAIVMKNNIEQMDEFIDFLMSLDIDRVLFQPIRDYYHPLEKWREYQYWINDYEKLDRGIDALVRGKKRNDRILNTIEDFEIMRTYFRNPYSIVNSRDCRLGYEQLAVDDKGEIFVCSAYSSLGNIRERNIKEIWKSKKAAEERWKMVTCTLPCTSNCKKELGLGAKAKKFVYLARQGLFDL